MHSCENRAYWKAEVDPTSGPTWRLRHLLELLHLELRVRIHHAVASVRALGRDPRPAEVDQNHV
jgi:hypothetical protein